MQRMTKDLWWIIESPPMRVSRRIVPKPTVAWYTPSFSDTDRLIWALQPSSPKAAKSQEVVAMFAPSLYHTDEPSRQFRESQENNPGEFCLSNV
jgi:hypothetical protein